MRKRFGDEPRLSMRGRGYAFGAPWVSGPVFACYLQGNRRLTPVLREAHARLRLWRLCNDKACRRRESCGGAVDEGGAGRRAGLRMVALRHQGNARGAVA